MSMAVRKTLPNLVNKKYMVAKFKRNMMLAPAVANLGIAGIEAHAHSLPTTVFFAAFGFMFLKAAEKSINKMLQYKPTYKEVVHRAIGIQIVKLENKIAEIRSRKLNNINHTTER